MAKIISSLPGSAGVLSKTSQLINDGETGISTYVELNDLSTVATTGDYNNLIDIPIDFTPKVHTHNISDISGTKSEFNTSLTDGNFLFVGDVLDAPDATVTTKGILKLTGDLGGTADNPTTPTAIHKIGDEIKQGILTLSDGLKIVGNTTSTTATKINVQENDGTINTISKSDLVNVVEVNDVPSLPLTGEAGKIYVVKNLNKIYRWNGTFYQELAVTDITYQSVIDALTFTPENVANKSDSYSVSSTVTYPSTKALVDGLATKVTGIGTTGRVQVSMGSSTIGNSSIIDNGSVVATVLPIHANSFVKTIGSTNLLLASGSDITQESLPISTATQTVLNLKANLASPALTGTPTAPTATVGTNTTQIATTAFVYNNVVTLSGSQTITGLKTFSSGQIFSSGSFFRGSGAVFDQDVTPGAFGQPSIVRYLSKLSIRGSQGGNQNFIASFDIDALLGHRTFSFPNQSGTFALTTNATSLRATSFIKSSTPATNILLAGGGDIAQNTAFNKPFGTSAGTVVEGGTLGSNAYTSTAYLAGSGTTNYIPKFTGSGTIGNSLIFDNGTNVGIGTTVPEASLHLSRNGINQLVLTNALATVDGSHNVTISAYRPSFGYNNMVFDASGYVFKTIGISEAVVIKQNGNLLIGTSTDNGVDKLQVNGSATFSSSVTATSYTATSLPVFENNTAASSLAVGQFYRTSTGVLMVKF